MMRGMDSSKIVFNKKKFGIKRGQSLFLVVMLTIPIVHWFIFWLYVNINSIVIAFQANTGEWSLVQFRIFFESLKNPDTNIAIAVKNTFIYFFSGLLITLPLSTFVAYFFYKKILMYRTLRVLLYLPAIISAVAMTAVFANFVKDDGPLGNLLSTFGVKEVPQLLADSRYATWTIVFYCIWTGVGTGTILPSGAMSRIPTEILEAASLDGCSTWREAVSIIFPLIWSTTSTRITLSLTGLFTSSGPILLFTKGSAGTTTISYWIFEQVYYYNSYNIVAAGGLFFTLLGVPIILLIRWLLEKIPQVEF